MNETTNRRYPDFFFRFTGSTEKSVKKFGQPKTGWDVGKLLRTRLLDNLDDLAGRIRRGEISHPVSVFFVGGPGNGKTEAAEHFMRGVYGCEQLPTYDEIDGRIFFRKAINAGIKGAVIVEDATTLPPGELKEDIRQYVFGDDPSRYLYLCCVNRGVLSDSADALDPDKETSFISSLSDVVSVGETSPHMWPLAGNELFSTDLYSLFAKYMFVWPMDVESLVDSRLYGNDPKNTPGYKLFERLFHEADSSSCEKCHDKHLCPFFENLQEMRSGKGIENIVYCLHAFEIASGTNILFRDLLSVANVLFSDSEDSYTRPKGDRQVRTTPCDWVHYHAEVIRSEDIRNKLASAFRLASRRYNQILFGDYSEFASKDMSSLRAGLMKNLDIEEFRSIERLIKAVSELAGKKKNKTRAWDMIHGDFARRMDVALDEGFDELEQIEIGFCSSTKIGSAVAGQKGVESNTLKSLLVQLCDSEERLGVQTFDVSTEKGDLSRRCLQLLQVLGSRMSKREVGGRKPAVYNDEDIRMYERICFSEDSSHDELTFVRRPLQRVLSLESGFSSHVLQSIGQTRLSPKYQFSITTSTNCKIQIEKSKTLPVSPSAPVDPTPEIVISFQYSPNSAKSARLRLTFPLFFALRKVKEGLSIASISEQTFVNLNLLSSKILGIVSHFSEEPKFAFPGKEDSSFVWVDGHLVKEDA